MVDKWVSFLLRLCDRCGGGLSGLTQGLRTSSGDVDKTKKLKAT